MTTPARTAPAASVFRGRVGRFPPDPERRPHCDHDGHQERAVVERRNHLHPEQQTGEESIAQAAACHRTVQPEQRQRHPDGHLQLEVREVLDPEGIDGEDRARQKGGVLSAGQCTDQQVGADAGKNTAGEKHQVVGSHAVNAEPGERREQHGRVEDRVRVGESPRLGIELVAVEDVQRIAKELLAHPR